MQSNLAHGFDRMHTWLALTHAQTPVEIVSEREIERLDRFKVCYLSGPNLTRAAVMKLRAWVEAGGTLWLGADARRAHEFNRPLDTLTSLLPATHGELSTPEPFQNTGRFLSHLTPRDTVTWGDDKLEVLSVQQSLAARDAATVLATFSDGTPAVVSGRAGNGRILLSGFLPALSYIKPALTARRPLDEQADEQRRVAEEARLKGSQSADQPEATNAVASAAPTSRAATNIPAETRELLERSYNPWQFSDGIRAKLLTPVRDAQLQPRITCDTPLVDVIALDCDQGVLLALSNFSLTPVRELRLTLRNAGRFQHVESVRHGLLKFTRTGTTLQLTLPLEAVPLPRRLLLL